MIDKEIVFTKALRVATTYKCPLNCHVCYAPKSNADMSDDLFAFLLEEGKKLGFESIGYGGGESLINKNQILRFLKMAKNEGYLNSITTSGYNLTIQYLKQLIKNGLDHLQLSLGYNRVNFYEKITILKDTKKVSYGFNFLVDPRRLTELPFVHKGFEQTDCSYIVYVIPKVNWELYHLRFTYDQARDYIFILSKIKKESKKQFFVGCATNFLRNQECLGLKEGISVSADGMISMCGYCDEWMYINSSLKDTINEFNKKVYTGKCMCTSKYMLSF